MVLVILGGPTGAALVVGALTSFGRGATRGYLAVVAEVLPVVFLAAILEARAVLSSAAPRMPEPTRRYYARLLRLYGALFLEAEGVALYAVGERAAPTTFLVLLPVIVGGLMVLSMFADMPAAVGLTPGIDERDQRHRRNFSRKLERLADRLTAPGQPAATADAAARTAQAESLRRAARQLDGLAEADDDGTTSGPQ